MIAHPPEKGCTLSGELARRISQVLCDRLSLRPRNIFSVNWVRWEEGLGRIVWARRVHIEIGLGSGFPVVGDVAKQRGDQAQERGGIGKNANHASAAFKFLVNALGDIGGAEADPMWWREREDGEAFW